MDRTIYGRVYAALEKRAAAPGSSALLAGALKAIRRGRLLKAVKRLNAAASPEVRLGKMNPLRLFTTTTRTPLRAENVRPITAGERAAGRMSGRSGVDAYATAYGSGGGHVPPSHSEWKTKDLTREVTRLSPAKILAAVGLTGAGGAVASSGGRSGAGTGHVSGGTRSVVDVLGAYPALAAALGLGVVGATGAATYSAAGKKRKETKD